MLKNGKLRIYDDVIDSSVSIADGYGIITNIRLEHTDGAFETFVDVEFEDWKTGEFAEKTYTIQEIFNYLT